VLVADTVELRLELSLQAWIPLEDRLPAVGEGRMRAFMPLDLYRIPWTGKGDSSIVHSLRTGLNREELEDLGECVLGGFHQGLIVHHVKGASRRDELWAQGSQSLLDDRTRLTS